MDNTPFERRRILISRSDREGSGKKGMYAILYGPDGLRGIDFADGGGHDHFNQHKRAVAAAGETGVTLSCSNLIHAISF